MNKWWTLYLKEMKDSANIFGLVIALILGIELLAIYHAGQMNGMVLSVLPLGLVITIVPIVMYYLYAHEWKTDARYLLLSLPIPRSMIGMSKFLAVLSLGCVLLILCFVGIFWNVLHFTESDFWQKATINIEQEMSLPSDMRSWQLIQENVWIGGIFFCLAVLCFLLGFAVIVQSVNMIIKKFKFFMTLFTGFAGWYIYFNLGISVFEWMFDVYDFAFLWSSGELSLSTLFIGWLAYTFLLGLSFLAGGLFLTEKYLEI